MNIELNLTKHRFYLSKHALNEIALEKGFGIEIIFVEYDDLSNRLQIIFTIIYDQVDQDTLARKIGRKVGELTDFLDGLTGDYEEDLIKAKYERNVVRLITSGSIKTVDELDTYLDGVEDEYAEKHIRDVFERCVSIAD